MRTNEVFDLGDNDLLRVPLVIATPKGLALIDAIEAGLVRPDGSGSYDTAAFNDFWRRLERREEDRRRRAAERSTPCSS